MKTLLLVRHAKAKAAVGEQDDHVRDLDEAGVAAAVALGHRLRVSGHKVDRVWVSSARRTQRTADLLLSELASPTIDRVTRDDLYLASAKHLIKIVHQMTDEIDTLMIVGHNPGLEEMARIFMPSLPHLRPADLVWVTFDSGRWRDASPAAVSQALRLMP